MFNPISKIKNRFRKESKDVNKAFSEESKAEQLEISEEKIDTKSQSEVKDFGATWTKEALLLKDLQAMQFSKYSLVKVFGRLNVAKRNLSAAKKRVFSNIKNKGKNVKNLAQRAAIGATGVASIDPSFGKKLESWVLEQQKQLQLLSHEVELQIKENEEEAASVNPILEKNKQIRGKLGEYQKLLGRQNRDLGSIKGTLLLKVRKERDEILDSQKALQLEIDALKQGRLAGAGR
jgi:hypothetical protein